MSRGYGSIMLSCPAPLTNTYWVSTVSPSATEFEWEEDVAVYEDWRDGGKEVGDGALM